MGAHNAYQEHVSVQMEAVSGESMEQSLRVTLEGSLRGKVVRVGPGHNFAQHEVSRSRARRQSYPAHHSETGR